MLQLFNLCTYEEELQLFNKDSGILRAFMGNHDLDGVELYIDHPWNPSIIPQQVIKGVHLPYWSNWLDFWNGNTQELLDQFGTPENIVQYYSGTSRAAFVDKYRVALDKAIATGAEYVVFHVSNARFPELFTYNFSYSDSQVIDAAIELVNAVTAGFNSTITLLFENLWWPGLTLRDQSLTQRLLENVNHPNVGIMLDTGHLMNTNPSLMTEKEGIEYIMKTLAELGSCAEYIKGIHLHRSLSGQYINRTKKNSPQGPYSGMDIMNHVMKIDEHLPFSIPDVRRIIDFIQPDYLVHEFLYDSMNDWIHKITKQQQALYGTSAKTT